jgi:DNA-binding transcriptional regulator YhcF (GntR family)
VAKSEWGTYSKIANHIREKIEDGSIKKGWKLPPESSLCAHYDCSRPTIRRALRVLEDEGVITLIEGGKRVVGNPEECGMSIRVPISYTLIIPRDGVEAWMTEYGVTNGQVREGIKNAVKTELQSGYYAELTGWEVEEN